MTTLVFLFLTVLAVFTNTANASVSSKNLTNKCDSSPLAIILETYYKGHPYKNVNLKRDSSHWNVFNVRVNLGLLTDYEFGTNVGKGKFSRVFKGVHKATGDQVAFKILVHNKDEKILKEVQILRELAQAPNFLPLRDVLREGMKKESKVAFVLDYFETKNYRELFEELTPYQVKYFIYETLRSLDYGHSHGICHRDIKPLNVLMNAEKLQVKVIDWGHSDYYLPGQRYSVRLASLHYKGPELLLNYTYHDYSLDIWSTGVMLAEMSFGKIHFFEAENAPDPTDPNYPPAEAKKRSFRAHLDAIAQILGTMKLKQYANKFKDDMILEILDYVGNYKKKPFTELIDDDNRHMISPELIDLLEHMLVYDHTKRYTAQEALQHRYFDEVRENLANGNHYKHAAEKKIEDSSSQSRDDEDEEL